MTFSSLGMVCSGDGTGTCGVGGIMVVVGICPDGCDVSGSGTGTLALLVSGASDKSISGSSWWLGSTSGTLDPANSRN